MAKNCETEICEVLSPVCLIPNKFYDSPLRRDLMKARHVYISPSVVTTKSIMGEILVLS
jgi:hypothetical protein